MKINPLADYVVAVQEETKTKTTSGLYLPEQSKSESKTAKVTAVGKDVKNVKVGDRIICKIYAPNEFLDGKTTYILVKEEEILATVSN